MRLALIGPVYPYRGGIAHFTTALYKALQRQGHQVLLVSFKRQYPRRLFPGDTDKDPSKNPPKVEEAEYWIDSVNPLTWFTTFARLRRSEPDAIVLQWWTTFWAPVWFLFGVLNRFFLRSEILYFCHNVLPHETRPLDRWLARLALHQGTEFIVQSEGERERLLKLIPAAEARISPLPAFDMFADHKLPKAQARAILELPQHLPVLLFFGIVREYKGLADLLQAMVVVRERLGQVLLVVAGEFWDDKQPYLDAIRRMGIGDSVLVDDRYIPNEQAAVYFSAADALVAPYRQVTGSAVIPTAHVFGLPVIATELPGIVQAVDRRYDRLVPPCAPNALAAAITEILAGNAHAKQLKDPCREAFTWDQLVAVIEASIHGALS